jgi:hypothetical protein
MNETIFYIAAILLSVIGFFLIRLIGQIDQLTEKFTELIGIVSELKTTLVEHKGDVLVIKERIDTHSRELDGINKLYDRMRSAENEITSIKASRAH